MKRKDTFFLESWEENLIAQVNLLDYFSLANVFFVSIVLNSIGFSQLNIHLLGSFFLGIGVLLLNYYKKYIIALYVFYSIGIFLVGSATYFMDIRTNVFLYFLPISFSIVLIMGRKELIKHMFIWMGIYLVIIILLFYKSLHHAPLHFDRKTEDSLSILNSLLAFILATVQVIFVTMGQLRKERALTKAFNEKQLLLAELFHRVKNNLSVVNSILSLRANASDSKEVKDALSECQSRVYSMALVHQQVYTGNEKGNLNMRAYLDELINNIQHYYGTQVNIILNLDQEHIDLPIFKAVPIGLIINELLSNAYKHAAPDRRELTVTVNMKVKANRITFEVIDNGIGFNLEEAVKAGSLGLDIIQSLCQQIDADLEQDLSVSEGTSLKFSLTY